MTLATFVDDFVALLPRIDREAPSRPDGRYLPGVGAMTETEVRDAVAEAMARTLGDRYENVRPELPYRGIRGAKCDLAFGEVASGADRVGWSIELKRISLVGDNGKNNDFGLAKILSPFPLHRSAIRDAQRLRDRRRTDRGAIVMYGFDFDEAVVDDALARCEELGIGPDRARNLEQLLGRNERAPLLVEPLFRIFDFMASQADVGLGPIVVREFGPLVTHPLYRRGHVAAWEVVGARRVEDPQGILFDEPDGTP